MSCFDLNLDSKSWGEIVLCCSVSALIYDKFLQLLKITYGSMNLLMSLYSEPKSYEL